MNIELIKSRTFKAPSEVSFNLNKAASEPRISEIKVFVLGPKGTNIGQAAKLWVEAKGLNAKANLHFCSSPKEALSLAKGISDNGSLPIFVLCAVYFDLHKLFFSNLDDCFFVDHFYMPLDNMQLCSRAALFELLPERAVVAVHRSPMPLVEGIDLEILEAKSNAHAALLCREMKADLCVTTESSRARNGLFSLHSFGKPRMLFTMGTTFHGAQMLSEYCARR